MLAQAGTGKWTGTATVSEKPEFITVNLSVKSVCFAKPSEAMQANNETTVAVQDFLKKMLDTSNGIDRLTTNGGLTTSYFRTKYDENNKPVTVCPNTFQQTTDVTFKTKNVAEFSRMFADIQEKVLGTFKTGEGDNAMAVTFVNIGSPNAGVCQSTSDAMELKAMDLATENAKVKFGVCAKRCGIDLQRTSIVSLSDSNSISRSSLAYPARARDSFEAPIVETNFDDINVTANVTLEMSFADAQYACDLSDVMKDMKK